MKIVECKRPGRKRENYEKLKSKLPFRFDFSSFLKIANEQKNVKNDILQEVRVEMLKKCSPLKYSYLCFPDLEDFKSLRIEFSNRNSILMKILNHTKNEPHEKTLNIFDQAGERTVIGRFTHGFFTYEKGMGTGRAYLSSENFKKLKIIT